MSHSHSQEVRNPGPYAFSSGTRTLLLLLIAVGGVGFALGLKSEPTRAWASFIHNQTEYFHAGCLIVKIEIPTIRFKSRPALRPDREGLSVR